MSDESFHCLITDQVRFGFGWKIINDVKTYYAWHGVPNRSDDQQNPEQDFCAIMQ